MPQAFPAPRAGERGSSPRRHLPGPRLHSKMIYPLVHELAADGIPVTVICRVLGLSPPGLPQVEGPPNLGEGLVRRYFTLAR